MANNGLTQSAGLQRLSHFRASRVSTSLYEPVYKNMYTLQLTPPEGMGLSSTDQEVLIVLEGVQSVQGLSTSPASGSPVEQGYKFAKRSFAGSVPKTNFDFTIEWEINLRYEKGYPENYTWKFLRQWNDLIYDPLSGRMGLKKDYVAPQGVVSVHDRAGVCFHQWVIRNFFPTGDIDSLNNWNYTDSGIAKASMKYRCDFWDEVTL